MPLTENMTIIMIMKKILRKQFVDEVEKYLASAGTSPSRLGLEAINCDKIINRVRKGGNITLKNADRIINHMRSKND